MVTGVGSGNNIFVNIYVKSVNNLSYLEQNHSKKNKKQFYMEFIRMFFKRFNQFRIILIEKAFKSFEN